GQARAAQRATGAVAPAALDADLLHEPRAEHAAEHRFGDGERGGIGMAVAQREVADPDLRLRAIGLVDEDQPAAARAFGVLAGVLDRGRRARTRRDATDQPIDDAVGRLLVDVAGEADHEVVRDDLLLPQSDRGLTLDLLERRFGAERGAA